jgi:hypothetical protein
MLHRPRGEGVNLISTVDDGPALYDMRAVGRRASAVLRHAFTAPRDPDALVAEVARDAGRPARVFSHANRGDCARRRSAAGMQARRSVSAHPD